MCFCSPHPPVHGATGDENSLPLTKYGPRAIEGQGRQRWAQEHIGTEMASQGWSLHGAKGQALSDPDLERRITAR